MNWIWLAAHDVTAIVCGTFLVYRGHPYFGGFLMFLAAATTVKEKLA